MIKCLFLIGTLGGGGAERVLVNLVNHLDRTAYDITVETMFDGGVNVNLLSPHIKYFCRSKHTIKGITKLFRFISQKALYRFYIKNQQYDLIVAFMHGFPTKVVAGCDNKHIKRIAWLHNGNPEKGTFFRPWFSEKKAIVAYDSMDRIVGVSSSVANAFANYTGINKNKIVYKYNTNDSERILKMANEPFSFDFDNDDLTIISVGSLSKVKGYDRLIRSAVKLYGEGFRFQLVIVGKGNDEDLLRQQILDSNAGNYIMLLGFQKNPYKIMKRSNIFISSSRSEGLATVLTEALTLGLPVISTDVSGAKEVLGEKNEYGIVVENSEDGIYKGLRLFMEDKEVLKKYADGAVARSKAFDAMHTVQAVDDLFKEVIYEQ